MLGTFPRESRDGVRMAGVFVRCAFRWRGDNGYTVHRQLRRGIALNGKSYRLGGGLCLSRRRRPDREGGSCGSLAVDAVPGIGEEEAAVT